MAVVVKVGGTDRTSQVHFDRLMVVNSIASRADTADLIFTTTGNWHPMAGNTVSVESASTEFGGVILDVQEEQVNPSQFRYTCNCRDYVYLLDRLLVVNTYTGQAASSIVSDIVTNNTSGFTAVGVQASASVGSQIFDYQPVSDCIQSLADAIEWNWGVSYAKDVQFFSALTQAAPVGTINVDSDTTTYGNMVISESAQNIKNDIFIKGFQTKSSATYQTTFHGDGTSKFFLLGYEPGSTASADISVTRAPAGSTAITQTINLDRVDGTPDNPVGTANDLFVCYDNMGLRYDVPPGSSDAIVATYTVMSEIPIEVQDTNSFSTMASREGGSGIHQFALTDPGLKANDGTDTLAQLKGTSLLSRYAYPRLQIRFTSFIQGWKAGQTLTITSTKRFGGFSKTFYVQTVKKRLVNHPSGGTPTLSYEIDCADNSLPL